MRITKINELVIEITTVLFIFLFTYAATSKLLDYQKFRVQLRQSPMLTYFADGIFWLVPAIEIVIAILLTRRHLRLIGLYASFSLLMMFTTYIIAITRFSDYVPCSCGGVLEQMSWNQHLIFNIGFVSLALTSIILHTDKIERMESGPSPRVIS